MFDITFYSNLFISLIEPEQPLKVSNSRTYIALPIYFLKASNKKTHIALLIYFFNWSRTSIKNIK